MHNEKLYTHNGETKNITQWADSLGVNRRKLSMRLRSGMSFHEAIKDFDFRKKIQYQYFGLSKTIPEWAEHLGMKSVTIAKRLAAGHPVEIAFSPKSLKTRSGKHYKTICVGGQNSKREHVIVVEQAIGKQIPKGAVIHHIDGNINNNSNNNLLLFPNDAYHFMIHARQRAQAESGNANYKKCAFCHCYDDPKNMKNHSTGGYRHRECYNAYKRAYNKSRHT